jgi:FKBP-type peptidyl-prolyl cis-trans isomerase
MNFLKVSLWVFALISIFAISTVSGAEKKKGDQTKYLKRVGAKFLEETAQKDGVIKLKSGMLVEVLKSSTKDDAKSPRVGDPCEVTYKGTFRDGKSFDSGTTSFAPNQVIKVTMT